MSPESKSRRGRNAGEPLLPLNEKTKVLVLWGVRVCVVLESVTDRKPDAPKAPPPHQSDDRRGEGMVRGLSL